MSAGPRTVPALPVTLVTVDRWIRAGLLRLDHPGTGTRRTYPPAEVRAMRAIVAARCLGGASPDGQYLTGSSLPLLVTVAELARTNEPGTAHEITSPVPWIRHVLVVS